MLLASEALVSIGATGVQGSAKALASRQPISQGCVGPA
jgi:hypothetical protein